MSNRVREIFDFAQLEPDSAFDIELMVKSCHPDELRLIEKIAGNLSNAVRNVKAKQKFNSENQSFDD